ncbi:MAG: hypothetical protein R8L07_15260 [Alphaproteobacteria bacterium]|nr:hypothetical protein [Alphaproteobacteria bacterium]
MASTKRLELRDATLELFKSHIGSKFETTLSASRTESAGKSDDGAQSDEVLVELELIECHDQGTIDCPDKPDSDTLLTRHRFCVVFSAPDNLALHDGAYDLRHAELGQISGISLSRDVGKDGKAAFLTAVFS